MSIPQDCTVLVIGGGPGGSFAATALAREGVNVVLLEADKFPRYHIGESMIPSMRPFLKFIDFYDAFNAHGFNQKNGAIFKFHLSQPEFCKLFKPDNLAAGGPEGYAWNVIRSEADDMLFKHAGSSGAHIFDTTKVNTIKFEPGSNGSISDADQVPNLGRPVSATWTRRDGTSGVISFEYLIDASGRQGILSTKYLKNRRFNEDLKNISNWGYWKGGGVFGTGTRMEGSPYFEALEDSSGWCWFIPLHDGTHSVGIVQNHQIAAAKKRELGSPSTKDFYLKSIQHLPTIKQLLSKAELVTDVKSASDWSYTATTYALPYIRIVGDAGCFIDPLFSQGVHIALMSGLSAAITIAASIKGDCDEQAAVSWHTKKITESYTRFYLVVNTIMKQILCQEKPILQGFHDDSFQSAVEILNPLIQGTLDASSGNISSAETSKLTELMFKMAIYGIGENRDATIEKFKRLSLSTGADKATNERALKELKETLNPEESQLLDLLHSSYALSESQFNINWFTLKPIDGLVTNMVHGNLGLVRAN